MELKLPREGLEELVGSWSGVGQLLNLLSSVQSEKAAFQWSKEDIVRRSNRILFEKLQPLIENWPKNLAQWEALLPPVARSESKISPQLYGKIDWLDTARRFGWPPRKYSILSKDRDICSIALSGLLWLSTQLHEIESDVHSISPIVVKKTERQLQVLSVLVEQYSIQDVISTPDNFELRALASAGRPWNSIATAMQLILLSKRDPRFLAYELLEPSSELHHELFHLATFGLMVRALRDNGCSIVWNAILRGPSPAPQIRVIRQDGSEWDLWFETGHVRNCYKVPPSAYQSAVKGIGYGDRSLSYDILLIAKGRRALILECKWSGDAASVGRSGFHQASSYALDARNGLAENVWSFVIGPEEVVDSVSIALEYEGVMGIVLGSAPAAQLKDVVEKFFRGSSC